MLIFLADGRAGHRFGGNLLRQFLDDARVRTADVVQQRHHSALQHRDWVESLQFAVPGALGVDRPACKCGAEASRGGRVVIYVLVFRADPDRFVRRSDTTEHRQDRHQSVGHRIWNSFVSRPAGLSNRRRAADRRFRNGKGGVDAAVSRSVAAGSGADFDRDRPGRAGLDGRVVHPTARAVRHIRHQKDQKAERIVESRRSLRERNVALRRSSCGAERRHC